MKSSDPINTKWSRLLRFQPFKSGKLCQTLVSRSILGALSISDQIFCLRATVCRKLQQPWLSYAANTNISINIQWIVMKLSIYCIRCLSMLLIKFQVTAANLRAAASCYKAIFEKKTKNFSTKREEKRKCNVFPSNRTLIVH